MEDTYRNTYNLSQTTLSNRTISGHLVQSNNSPGGQFSVTLTGSNHGAGSWSAVNGCGGTLTVIRHINPK